MDERKVRFMECEDDVTLVRPLERGYVLAEVEQSFFRDLAEALRRAESCVTSIVGSIAHPSTVEIDYKAQHKPTHVYANLEKTP